MQTMSSYNLEEYSNIVFNGFKYVLPENIKLIIQNLTTELGVSISSATLHNSTNSYSGHNEKDSNYKRISTTKRSKHNNKMGSTDNDAWDKVKKFQTTKIEKKEGVEKSINDICACLNKISNKNYEIQRESIFMLIRQTMIIDKANVEMDTESNNDEEQHAQLNQISNAIFNIASTNKFYSEIYADLYRDLINEFPIFNNNVNGFTQKYIDCVSAITFVDQNTDYDKYCDNNKMNDKRKATAAFIVNLMIRQIIDKESVLNIIIKLEEIMLLYIDEANKTYEVEEITENIFVFITMAIKHLKSTPVWNNIVETIKTSSLCKSKVHPSLSSRAIFKYMDIYDFIKNNGGV